MTADGTSAPLLELRDVCVGFDGLVALDNVNLRVEAGQVLGVIGPNGAGKTTLFNAVCGFVRPRSGELLLRGEPLRSHRAHQLAALGIARTLQGLGLFAYMTVAQNVMVGATRRRRTGFVSALIALPRADREEQQLHELAIRTLEKLGIDDAADIYPGQLSHGDQKKVALARALVAEPELLLLDEPAAGLSATEIAELSTFLRTLRASTSIVLVEHHMDFVMGLCDAVAVLDFGKLIAHGTPDAVRDDPLVISAYLGEAADA